MVAKSTKIPLKPLQDFVLVDPIPTKMTKGGVALPDGASLDDTARGTVVKAGPGRLLDDGKLIPNPIKVGDVVYHMALTQPFKYVFEGHLYLLMSGSSVVALEEESE